MSNPPTIPEGRAFTDAWRRLDRDARRRVRRAVNRAQPAADPREAALAVAVARGQQRFWRFGWLLGPAFAVVLLLREPVPAVIANGIFAVAVFGLLAVLFTRRARRAERVNLEAARKGKRRTSERPRSGKKRSGKKRKR